MMSRAASNVFDTPRSPWTFGELIRRVARSRGLAPEVGTNNGIPEDADTLQRVKDAVNQGLARFYSATNWTFLEPFVAITTVPAGDGALNIDGDAARYRLPLAIQGQPLTDWRYLTNNALVREARRVDFGYIRKLFSTVVDTAGYPRFAACAPLPQESPDDLPGWQVAFWPAPDAVFQLEAQFYLLPAPLVSLDDAVPIPAPLCQAAYLACVVELLSEDATGADAPMYDRKRQDYESLLQAAIRLDALNKPVSVGMMRDPSAGLGLTREDALYLSYNGVTQVSGQSTS
jgi:hypothetical protein